MNDLVKKVKGVRIGLIALALVLIALGLALAFNPTESQIFIFRGIGIVLCIWGLVHIILYFRTLSHEVMGSFGLVKGVALIAFGVYFIVNPIILVSVFGTLVAIVILIDGILKIQYSLDLHKMDSKNWWIDLIGSIIMVVLGVIALFNPFTSADTLMIFAGVILVVEGIWDLVSVTRISIVAKRLKKAAMEANAVEATAVEVETVEVDE